MAPASPNRDADVSPDGAHAPSTGSRPEVSVVVATHNRADRLALLLEALERQSTGLEFEVIVVDDASHDDTASVLAAWRRNSRGVPLTVISRSESGGPAVARDAGWRAASAPLIAFTDDDCRPQPGWLAAGAACASAHPGVIVQGRTIPDPDHADRRGPFSRTIDVPKADPAFQTCNVFYPRSLLERIDGFDVAAFGRDPGGEDADLAWRAIATGARAVFAEAAVVRHEVADLGPAGKLRVAWRWTGPMRAYVDHPELRRAHFADAVFWKHTHRWLAMAVVASMLRGRARVLSPLLALQYARSVRARGILEGGGVKAWPFFVLHDLVEMVAVLRAAARFRSPML